MTKGREGSDGRTVPEGRRKAVPIVTTRGGKATTASESEGQLTLLCETADSPKGDDGGAEAGQPVPATIAVPKSRSTTSTTLPAMTMEEVANEGNLRVAFWKVAPAWDDPPRLDPQVVRRSARPRHTQCD